MHIILRLFSLILLVTLTTNAEAQKGKTEIKFELSNYDNDTLLIGYYYGDRTLVYDTLSAISKGKFILERNEPIGHGMYIALYQPNNEYFQFMISEDQQFVLKGDYKTNDLVPKGDKDNEIFYDYLQFIRLKGGERNSLLEQKKTMEAAGEDLTKLKTKLAKLDDDVEKKQNKIISENPSLMVAKLLSSNLSEPIPVYEGTESEISMKKYLHYKRNYFKYIDLADSSLLKTPFLHERVTYYEEKLTPQQPDSIIESINYLLGEMKPSPPTYRFYLSHFLNKYAKSQVIGYDAIYVRLIDKYYMSGETPWVSEETMKKFKENADKLRPILIGEQAPPITFYKEDGSEQKLYDIDSKYTVMIFWAPSCGHCKKAMPGLIKFYEDFKPKGVEILAICTKHRDKYETCWEYINENKLPFVNVGDQYHKSRFRDKYNVVSTPRVFILDQNKKILLKRVPTENLSEIMEALIIDLEKEVIEDQGK